MFKDFISLIEIKFNFDIFTAVSATDMSYMFSNCSSIKQLNLNGFDTENTIDMEHMFYSCTSLSSLDLSSFNTLKVKYFDDIFGKCQEMYITLNSKLCENLVRSEYITSNIHINDIN